MKQLFLLLLALLTLTGCTSTQAPVDQDETPTEAVSESMVEVPNSEPEPIPATSQPKEEPAPVPQNAAFLWRDTAVSADGSVVLQIQGCSLRFLCDEITGAPQWIVSRDENGDWVNLYALDGTPMDDFQCPQGHLAGTLSWSDFYGNVCIRHFPDGEVVSEGLRAVIPVGDQLALIPNFQYGSIVFLDPQTGTETLRLESGFQLAEPTFLWSGSGYLPVTAPSGDGMNLIDSNGTPLLPSFYSDIIDLCYGYAIVQPEAGSSRYVVIDLSTKQELSQTVFNQNQEFLALPHAALLCEGERKWKLVDWQGTPLFSETFWDRPIVYEENGIPQYLVGQILRGTAFIPVILRPDGTVLGELPADPSLIELASSAAITYTIPAGSNQEAHLYILETGEDLVLTQGGSIVLSASMDLGTGDFVQVRQIETSGGHMFPITVDNRLCLFLNDGSPGRQDLGRADYLGHDVFSTEDGLRNLDGQWFYRP